MLICLCGTSGSGKTTAARGFLERAEDTIEVKRKFKGRERVVGYLLRVPGLTKRLFLVGAYDNACGGCDGIPDTAFSRKLIAEFAKAGHHVLFEGLIMTTLYQRNLKLMRDLKQPFAMAFMDTPLRVCISRVEKRRKKKDNDKPLDPKNTMDKFFAFSRMLGRAVRDKACPEYIAYKDATNQLFELFRSTHK